MKAELKRQRKLLCNKCVEAWKIWRDCENTLAAFDNQYGTAPQRVVGKRTRGAMNTSRSVN